LRLLRHGGFSVSPCEACRKSTRTGKHDVGINRPRWPRGWKAGHAGATANLKLTFHLDLLNNGHPALWSGHTMFAHVKFGSALVGLVCIAVGCMNGGALAVTDAEVAKKCAALTAKAFPPRVPGNPAAGLAKGTAQSERDYFNKCVANRGNMDDDVPKQ